MLMSTGASNFQRTDCNFRTNTPYHSSSVAYYYIGSCPTPSMYLSLLGVSHRLCIDVLSIYF